MPPLHEMQRAFAEAVTEGRHHVVATMIVPEASAHRSIALYRRLIRCNYTQVLKVTYPVLHRLVGDRYFGILARGYGKFHPSTSGDLFLYGRHLPAFLHELQLAPLLPELARLEWACHEVYQGTDSTLVSPEQIQAIASVDLSSVTVRFHEAARLLSFPIPVHRVWLALQPDPPSDDVVDLPLPEEETAVVVTRGGGKVQIAPLAKPDYLVLEALSRGVNLASVERRAIESNPDFDFQHLWATVLKLSMISGFSVSETS